MNYKWIYYTKGLHDKIKRILGNELDRFLKQKKPFGHDNFNDQTWKKLQKKIFGF